MSQSVRQSSFARGEIAPSLQGRSDIPGYSEALARCRDFIVTPTGALMNRPGTKYIAAVKTHADRTYLVPFVYGAGSSSILEFDDLFMRVYTADAYVTEVVSPFAKADLGNLRWAQYGDVMTFTCKKADGSGAYQPRELRRGGASTWTFSTLSFAPTANFIGAPTAPTFDSAGASYNSGTTYKRGDYVTVAVSGPPTYTIKFISIADNNVGCAPATSTSQWAPAIDSNHPPKKWEWKVVQVFRDAYGQKKRTAPSAVATGASADGEPVYSDRPVVLSWTTESGGPSAYKIVGYEVFKGLNGVFGYIGETVAGTRTFKDEGFAPDFSRPPPLSTDPFVYASSAGGTTADYPELVCFFEQRRVFARTKYRPQAIFATKSDDIDNFDVSPLGVESDAMEFAVISAQRNEPRHLVPLRTLLVLGQSAEVDFSGRGNPISNSNLQPRTNSHNGSLKTPVIVADGRVLYVVERGYSVRDLFYDLQADAYQGGSLSAYASHLFAGDIAVGAASFSSVPYSIAWFAMDESAYGAPHSGCLLGLTYDVATGARAWHRHDVGGIVESLATIPGSSEDETYMVVRRTINGSTKRYIERLTSRMQYETTASVLSVYPPIFLDSWLMVNGYPGTMTVTLTGGTTWAAEEADITCTAGSAVFAAGDVGKQIVIDPGGSTECRATITGYTSTTVVTVVLDTAIPAAYQGIATTDWYFGLTTLTGLTHLEGKSVKVYGEDGVVSGPYTVTSGAITLESPLYYAFVGLPYEPLGELLDVASERSVVKSVKSASIEVVASRGLWVGEDEDHLFEWKQRTVADGYGTVPLATQTVDVSIRAGWNKGGRIVFKQKDPLPLTVVGVTREVEFGGKT